MVEQMVDRPSTINIAVPFELIMNDDITAILELKLGENPRVLETDSGFQMIMLSECNLDSLIALFDIAPYVTLEKTFEEFIHTGTDLMVDFIVGLNVEIDL